MLTGARFKEGKIWVEFQLHLLIDKDQGNDLGFLANKSNRLHERFASVKV